MRINRLRLKDFCGIPELSLDFGDFTCLTGGNGSGKTTILNAISLLCSSLDFAGGEQVSPSKEDWVPSITAQDRLRAYLSKNTMIGKSGFEVEGHFEHNRKKYKVELNEKGYSGDGMYVHDWWWNGICHFAKFDLEMTRFQLNKSLWPQFSKHYEGITGIPVEPEFYTETDLAGRGVESDMAIGFVMNKGRRGKIPCRMGSAGEKKLARSLSQIVNIARTPDIALVDNLEMHVHHTRHLRMFKEIKSLFKGIQVVSTTHSTVVMQEYEPRKEIIDLDKLLGD